MVHHRHPHRLPGEQRVDHRRVVAGVGSPTGEVCVQVATHGRVSVGPGAIADAAGVIGQGDHGPVAQPARGQLGQPGGGLAGVQAGDQGLTDLGEEAEPVGVLAGSAFARGAAGGRLGAQGDLQQPTDRPRGHRQPPLGRRVEPSPAHRRGRAVQQEAVQDAVGHLRHGRPQVAAGQRTDRPLQQGRTGRVDIGDGPGPVDGEHTVGQRVEQAGERRRPQRRGGVLTHGASTGPTRGLLATRTRAARKVLRGGNGRRLPVGRVRPRHRPGFCCHPTAGRARRPAAATAPRRRWCAPAAAPRRPRPDERRRPRRARRRRRRR